MNYQPLEAKIATTLPHDKCLHIIVGLIIFTAVHFVSIEMGIAAVALAGLGKEFADWYTGHGTADVWDFVATVVGGIFGWICSFTPDSGMTFLGYFWLLR